MSEQTLPLDLRSTTSGSMAIVRVKSANTYIFRALLGLASANLLIRIMGMFNQVVVTAYFGQGSEMDAYFVASTLPILLAQLLASGLEASVIPVYTQLRTKGSREQASRLFSTLLNLLLVGMFLLTVAILIFRSQLVLFSAPGLKPQFLQLATGLTSFIFPVLLLMVMNSFLECLLNSEGHFGWPAYAGIFVPLTTVTLVLIAGPSYGIVTLCIGTLVGQLLQMCMIILRARKAQLSYQPIIDWRMPELAAIGIVAWPALFAALISQASPLVDQIFSSSLTPGSIAVLNNALKIISVPTGVIFTSVGRAILPYLSRQASAKDMKAFKETLRLYLWAVGIVTTGLAICMFLFAHIVVQILFQHGAFSADDTNRTATTMIGFVIGLAPMAMGFIISRAFSALRKTKILMYVTVFSIVANALFDYIFSRFWQSFGIALATSMVYVCTMLILVFLLRATIGKLSLFTPPHELMQVLQKLRFERFYVQWVNWKKQSLISYGVPPHIRRKIIRMSAGIAIFAGGIVGTILNDLYTLRVAFGAIIILVLLRYRSLLLVTWVVLDVFIGSSFALFNGKNLDTGLTIPTVLLLAYLPMTKTFQRMSMLPFFLVYLVWVLLGIGISPLNTGQFLTQWLILVDCFAVIVVAINILTTRQRVVKLIDVILLVSLFVALYGIYGYITKQNGQADTQNAAIFRISSIFGTTSTVLAFFLSVIIPLAFYRTYTLKGLKRIGCIIVTVILLAALGLTFTRSAFISVAFSLAIMIPFLPSSKTRVRMLAGLAALGGLTALLAITNVIPLFTRFSNADLGTLNGRTYLWQALLSHFDPTQLLGRGLSASDVLIAGLQVSGGGRGVIANSAHSLFLTTLYDHGIIGLLLLLLMFVTLAGSLIAMTRKATGDHRMICVVALAVFIITFIHALISPDFWDQGVTLYFWITMALPFASCWFVEERPITISVDTYDDESTEPRLRAIPSQMGESLSEVFSGA